MRAVVADNIEHVAALSKRGDAVVDGAAADNQVRPERGDVLDVLPGYPPVDLKKDLPVADQFPCLGEASFGARQELLAAPAGVDGKEEDQLELVQERFNRL